MDDKLTYYLIQSHALVALALGTYTGDKYFGLMAASLGVMAFVYQFKKTGDAAKHPPEGSKD